MPSTSKIIVSALLIALAAVAAVVFGIMLFVDPPPLPRAVAGLGFVAGLAGTVGSVLWLVSLNRRWKQDAIAVFRERPGETLADWEVPLEDWVALAALERKENRAAAPFAGGCLFLVLGGPTAWVCWEWLGAGRAIIAALVVGGIAGFLAAIGVGGSKVIGFKGAQAAGRGRVELRPDSLLLNGKEIIPWGGLYGDLETFEVGEVEGLSFPVLKIEIRKVAGDSTHLQSFRLPVAESARGRLGAVAADPAASDSE